MTGSPFSSWASAKTPSGSHSAGLPSAAGGGRGRLLDGDGQIHRSARVFRRRHRLVVHIDGFALVNHGRPVIDIDRSGRDGIDEGGGGRPGDGCPPPPGIGRIETGGAVAPAGMRPTNGRRSSRRRNRGCCPRFHRRGHRGSPTCRSRCCCQSSRFWSRQFWRSFRALSRLFQRLSRFCWKSLRRCWLLSCHWFQASLRLSTR